MEAVMAAIKYLLIQTAMSGEALVSVLALSVVLAYVVVPFLADKLTAHTVEDEKWVAAAMANLQRAIADTRTNS
jgi:fatty acid desaturase